MNNFGLLRKLVEGKELTFEEAKSLGFTDFSDKQVPFKYLFRKKNKKGEGAFGEVYKILNNKSNFVVKIPYDYKNVKNGYVSQLKAYNQNIKCPKPEGLFNVFNWESRSWDYGFVMEEIQERGTIFHKRIFDGLEIWIKKNKEILKSKMNGFSFHKDVYDNYVVTPNREVYLIDFDFWKTKNKSP